MSETPTQGATSPYPAPVRIVDPGWIGPYRLIEVIGEGGFGIVWLAERREPFIQRVAIKVIKPGMDSHEIIARFEQERQALAVMDHPNVAKVLDGGVTEPAAGSRPYFVMEYVKGEPITAFCDRNRLGINDRLRLFIQACEAVQHAHQKGIIHRDLKPSNVLVAFGEVTGATATGTGSGSAIGAVAGTGGSAGGGGGGGGIVKVIDFGVAKAVTHTLTDKTIFTQTGQIIGTPEYMSPEQAEMGRIDIDTRTDVYSLGVMLYELLTGTLPFDPKALRSKGYDEIRRIIRDIDPPKPSTRLSTLGDEHMANIARARDLEPGHLTHTLARELEWIPLKAMQKDRARRYASARELAQDAEHYLRGEALLAGPESKVYRLRKAAARNRAPLAAAATLVLILAATTAVSIYFARREALARKRTEEARAQTALQRDLADTTLGFINDDIFGALDPDLDGADVQLSVLLDRVVPAIEQRLKGNPEAEFRIRTLLGKAYLSVGRPREAIAQLSAGLEVAGERIPEGTPERIIAQTNLAEAQYRQASGTDAAEAIRILREVVADLTNRHGPRDPLTLSARNQLAGALKHAGELDAAEAEYRSVLAERTAVLGDTNLDTLITAYNLALLPQERAKRLRGAGNENNALPLFEEALAQLREVERRELAVLAPETPEVLNTQAEIGAVLMRLRRNDESVAAFERVLPRMETTYGANHWRTLEAQVNYGLALSRAGKLDTAALVLDRALEGYRVVRGRAYPDTIAVATMLADALVASDQRDAAAQTLKRAYADTSEVDAQSRQSFLLAGRLAELAGKSGRETEAAEWQIRAMPK